MRVPPPKIAYGYLQATKQLSYENKRTEHWSRKHGFLKLTSGKHYMVKLWPLGLGEGHKFRTYLILKVYSSICNIFFFIYSVLDRLVPCLIPWRLSKVIYSICCRLLGVARTQFSVLSAKDNPEAPFTLYRRNLKTAFSLWKRIKCFPSTLRRRNLKTQQSAAILDLFLKKYRAVISHRDGLVWTVVLTRLRFQISSAYCGRKAFDKFSEWKRRFQISPK